MPEIAGKKVFYAKGLRFSCIRCSNCCRHESGFVFLSWNDVSRLRAALNMEYNEFRETFCRWIPSANGTSQLSLREKSNLDCIFWKTGSAAELNTNAQAVSGLPEAGGCSVYNSRPLQCRSYPFWPSVLKSGKNWKMTGQDCPGMDRGTLHSPDTIEKWLAQWENEPIISRSMHS